MRRKSLWAMLVVAALMLLAGLWASQTRAAAGGAPSGPGGLVARPAAMLPAVADKPLQGTPSETPTTAPASTATPTPAVTCISNFKDVPIEYWAYGYIEWMYCHFIINGYDCGPGCMGYRPEAKTTRAQIAKMLTLGFSLPLVTPATATFADAPTTAWFYTWVESVHAYGVFNGYGCGGPGEPCDAQNRPYFRPSNTVNRAQIAKVVVLTAGWTLISPPVPTFTDVDTNYWAYSFIETAFSQAVIGGYNCKELTPEPTPQPMCREFRPEFDATRAQISKMMYIAITPPPPVVPPGQP